jgi:hypothetical protein
MENIEGQVEIAISLDDYVSGEGKVVAVLEKRVSEIAMCWVVESTN